MGKDKAEGLFEELILSIRFCCNVRKIQEGSSLGLQHVPGSAGSFRAS